MRKRKQKQKQSEAIKALQQLNIVLEDNRAFWGK